MITSKLKIINDTNYEEEGHPPQIKEWGIHTQSESLSRLFISFLSTFPLSRKCSLFGPSTLELVHYLQL